MAELENIKRILADDYSSEDRDMINRLAGILNPFMEQVLIAFDNEINFKNLNQDLIKVTVKVDSNGVPSVGDKIRYNVKGKFQGVYCINHRNLDNVSTYPTGAIQLSVTTENSIMTVNKITGLQADQKYELTLIVYGS